MRTLWILRHAKAGPHSADDHGRHLAARGHRQCTELAGHLAAASGTPKLVVCSSATRALETAEGVLGGLGAGAVLRVEPSLYQADADDVIEIVRRTEDELAEVMVVGHNPTLFELVGLLLGHDDGDGRQQLEAGLPTGALAVVSLEADRWAAVSPRQGRLVELFVPGGR